MTLTTVGVGFCTMMTVIRSFQPRSQTR
jgi:hypothetical protein